LRQNKLVEKGLKLFLGAVVGKFMQQPPQVLALNVSRRERDEKVAAGLPHLRNVNVWGAFHEAGVIKV
jgi:hypothetical protein